MVLLVTTSSIHVALAALVLAGQRSGVASEVISDLASIVAPSPSDERRALELKAEQFWQTVLSAAERVKMTEHLELYRSVEEVVRDLPAENVYVRKTLTEALERLKQADEMVLTQAASSTGLASEQLASPAGELGWSFFSAGQNYLAEAIRRFVSGGRYGERLLQHVGERQAAILPVLRGMAGSTGDVLTDTRTASRLAFDVLKYDIYNKGVPKTPKPAKDIAYKLVDAVAETRHGFMQFVTKAVDGIREDFQGRYDDASATVVRSALSAAETLPAASGEMPFVNL